MNSIYTSCIHGSYRYIYCAVSLFKLAFVLCQMHWHGDSDLYYYYYCYFCVAAYINDLIWGGDDDDNGKVTHLHLIWLLGCFHFLWERLMLILWSELFCRKRFLFYKFLEIFYPWYTAGDLKKRSCQPKTFFNSENFVRFKNVNLFDDDSP